MLRRVTNPSYLVALGVAATLLTAPALGTADSGGGGVAPSGDTAQTQSGGGRVSATDNGVTITTRASGFLGRDISFTGSAPRSAAGKQVEIERFGSHTGGRWMQTTHAKVQSDGSFSGYWHVAHPGQFGVRAVLAHGSGGNTASSWPTVDVTVYRMAVATIYGSGFWNSRTACGERLHRTTLGVAHRTLPCGTKVRIYYRGRTIEVPVIDRGPYANGADWDLTEATARALHMDSTERVGAAAMPRG